MEIPTGISSMMVQDTFLGTTLMCTLASRHGAN